MNDQEYLNRKARELLYRSHDPGFTPITQERALQLARLLLKKKKRRAAKRRREMLNQYRK